MLLIRYSSSLRAEDRIILRGERNADTSYRGMILQSSHRLSDSKEPTEQTLSNRERNIETVTGINHL